MKELLAPKSNVSKVFPISFSWRPLEIPASISSREKRTKHVSLIAYQAYKQTERKREEANERQQIESMRRSDNKSITKTEKKKHSKHSAAEVEVCLARLRYAKSETASHWSCTPMIGRKCGHICKLTFAIDSPDLCYSDSEGDHVTER